MKYLYLKLQIYILAGETFFNIICVTYYNMCVMKLTFVALNLIPY